MAPLNTVVFPLAVFCILQVYKICNFSVMAESIMLTLICAPYFIASLHPRETREIGIQTDSEKVSSVFAKKSLKIDMRPIIPFALLGGALSLYTTYGL
jgi:hypothetical protein